MAHEDGDLTLSVGGREISGWQSVRVTRGIERVPNDFDIEFTERFPGATDAVITPGDPCTVSIGSDLVITGYVDVFAPRFDRNLHTLRCHGRSKSQDMVDCSAEWPGGQISGANVLVVAQKLAERYGIGITSKEDTGKPIPQFNLMLGETGWEIVERITRYSALLCYDLPDGNMVLSRVGTEKHASGLKEGENVEAANVTFSTHQRYSNVVAFRMSVNPLVENGDSANIIASEPDPGVKRHRQLDIISEQVSGGEALARLRAKWEVARRIGRSFVVEATVDSWRDSAGKLWTPNWLVPIELPTLKMTDKTWLIGQVTYNRGEQGTQADLMIMPPDGFKPEPSIIVPPALTQDELDRLRSAGR